MSVRRHIFLFALVASLAIHLGALGTYLGYAKLHPARPQAISAQPKSEELIVQLDDLGSATGTGIGSNSSPGDQPLQAREADVDQALLSRDPTGLSHSGGPPAKITGPIGDGAGGMPAVAVASPPAPPTPEPKPEEPKPQEPRPPAPPVQVAAAIPLPQIPEAPIQSESKPKMTEAPPAPPAQPAPPEPQVSKPAPTPPPATPVAVAKPQPNPGDGRMPGTPQPAGEPLPQSESDSDPFSRISANLKFRNGKLVERWGRLVKTTRPQVNIAGIIDAWTLNNPTVVLEVHISATGKVTDVKVAHSSGSNQIDQPTREAVYDWWFEPAKNRAGKPVADVIFFTVEFM